MSAEEILAGKKHVPTDLTSVDALKVVEKKDKVENLDSQISILEKKIENNSDEQLLLELNEKLTKLKLKQSQLEINLLIQLKNYNKHFS